MAESRNGYIEKTPAFQFHIDEACSEIVVKIYKDIIGKDGIIFPFN